MVAECSFQEGQRVWAKIKGFPYWPAVLVPHNPKYFRNGQAPSPYLVCFCDTHEVAWCKESQLLLSSPEQNMKFIAAGKKSKFKRSFAAAVDEFATSGELDMQKYLADGANPVLPSLPSETDSSEVISEMDSPSDHSEDQPKSKRGRKRKPSNVIEEAPKSKQGRKKKVLSESDELKSKNDDSDQKISSDPEETPKSKRGRKKKVRTESQQIHPNDETNHDETGNPQENDSTLAESQQSAPQIPIKHSEIPQNLSKDKLSANPPKNHCDPPLDENLQSALNLQTKLVKSLPFGNPQSWKIEDALQALFELAQLPITLAILKSTGIGKVIHKLCKISCADISVDVTPIKSKAIEIMNLWKTLQLDNSFPSKPKDSPISDIPNPVDGLHASPTMIPTSAEP